MLGTFEFFLSEFHRIYRIRRICFNFKNVNLLNILPKKFCIFVDSVEYHFEVILKMKIAKNSIL